MQRSRIVGPEARIVKLRQFEEALHERKQSNQASRDLEKKAQWETQSDRKLERIRHQEAFARLQTEKRERLAERRQKLRLKLREEDDRYLAMLKEQEESPEVERDRRAEKAKRILQLRKDEAARLREELVERQFRENCDPLRRNQSAKMTQRTLEERNKQIEENTQKRILEEEEKRHFDLLNQRDKERKEQRHEQDLIEKEQKRQDFVNALEQQVKMREAVTAAQTQARIEDMKRMGEEWQNQWRLEAEDAKRKAARKQTIAHEMRQACLEKQESNVALSRQQREEELLYLEEAIKRENEAARREAEKKQKNKAELDAFRRQTEAMIKTKTDETEESDMLLKKYIEEQKRSESEKELARTAARDALLQEVHATRQAQIQEKIRQNQGRQREVQRERERLLQEEQEMREVKEKELVEAARRALERKLDLENQIRQRAQLKAAEEQQHILQAQVAQEADKMYGDRIEKVLKADDAPVWYGRKKVDWYD